MSNCLTTIPTDGPTDMARHTVAKTGLPLKSSIVAFASCICFIIIRCNYIISNNIAGDVRNYNIVYRYSYILLTIIIAFWTKANNDKHYFLFVKQNSWNKHEFIREKNPEICISSSEYQQSTFAWYKKYMVSCSHLLFFHINTKRPRFESQEQKTFS